MDLVPDWQPWKLKSVFVHRLNVQTTPQATPVLQPLVPDHTIAPLQPLFILAVRVASKCSLGVFPHFPVPGFGM